jgi:cytochrome c553
MPDIVKFGRSIKDSNGRYLNPTDRNGNVVLAAGGVEDGGIRACGFCHSAHGVGHPGNAPVAGLPAGYMMQQMDDFKNGLRLSSDPKKGNVIRMAWYAAQMTPAETKAAVEYFAALPFPQNIKVVETDTVPKTHRTEYFEPLQGAAAGTEPIAGRIIEVPENPELTGLRAPNTGFIAYAPIGSIAKGERLASTLQCRLCHGPDLGGLNMGTVGGEVPPIAGRSPSYAVRQLFDMKTGARRGAKSSLMKAVVDKMTPEDMLNVAAYVASLAPPARLAALPASR